MTDLYVIRWLLQNTERQEHNIVWQQNINGIYFTNVNDGHNLVRVEIAAVSRPPRTIVRLFSNSLGEIQIQEPLTVPFRKKYESEDDEILAKTIKYLFTVVSNKHATSELNEDERRQAIYKRLIFPDDTGKTVNL